MADIGPLARLANPSAAATRWADIARMAVTLRKRRSEHYPLLVVGGRMTEEEASADLQAWSDIVADWDWICTGSGKPASKDTLPARIAALDLALTRWLAIHDGPERVESSFYAEGALIAAMRWHLEPKPFGQSIHFLASVGHRWRALNPEKLAKHRAKNAPLQPQRKAA